MRRAGIVVLVLAGVAAAPTPARAELWPDLAHYVEWSDLIVYCRAEVEGQEVRYQVVEVWKGEYRPDRFHHQPPVGYLYTGTWHGNEDPADGREVVFFFTDRQPGRTGGKLRDHSTAMVVTGGKVVYAPTDHSGGTEYTLPEFRAFVRAAVRWQGARAVAAVAGGWAFAGVDPPVESTTRVFRTEPAPVDPPALPEPAADSAAAEVVARVAAAVGVCGLAAVYVWRTRRSAAAGSRPAPAPAADQDADEP